MSIEKLCKNDVALIGIMSDENSSFLRGAAAAPGFIRKALHCGSANLCSELGVDLAGNPRFVDVGDRKIARGDDNFLSIESEICTVLATGALPLVLGGDHSISHPVLRAVYRFHGPVNILHFDAHPDLYDEFEGNPDSHASPFARIMENGFARRLVQIGIRTLNAELREQVKRFGVETHEMRNTDCHAINVEFDGPVYISCDIDALDPAFAPGVSHHEPGGLSVRDILGVIHSLSGQVIGADIVEFNPSRDINGMTAMVAAKLLKEIAGKMLTS